jgi:hypothetical protein
MNPMMTRPSETPPILVAAGHRMRLRAMAAMSKPSAPPTAIVIASVCIVADSSAWGVG